MNEPNIPSGSEESVFITSITSPKNFFCQLAKTCLLLDDLMNQMEEYYRPLGEDEEAYISPRVGEACCAKFSEDDGWYRAVVTKVNGKTIGLRYIDYGNSEELPLARVKVLNARFTELSAQAFNASLRVPRVDIDLSSFEASVAEEELRAKVVGREGNGPYEVELFGSDGASLFTVGEKDIEQGNVVRGFYINFA